MSEPLSQPPAPNPDGVADEWAAVAATIGSLPTASFPPAAPPAPAPPAADGWNIPPPAVRPAPPAVAHAATGVATSVATAPAAATSPAAPVAVADAPPHRSADLRLAMLDPGSRRDLRRILIAFGAIGRPRPPGATGNPVRPEDVVGAFVTADTGLLEALLRNAGAIRDEARLARFVEAIADVGARTDPADPRAIVAWITDVGAILRDDAM